MVVGPPLKSARLRTTYANGAKVDIKLTTENVDPDSEIGHYSLLSTEATVPPGVYHLCITPIGKCCPERMLVHVQGCPRHETPGGHCPTAAQLPVPTCEPLVIPPGDDDDV